MTVVLDSRADLTLESFRRVAHEGEDLAIGSRAVERMSQARDAFVRLLEGDREVFIYQTTTGGGPLASVAIAPGEQAARARLRNIRPSLGDSFGGADLPERVVRGIVLARLADYVEGHAKSRPSVAQAIAALLQRQLPELPLGGATGAGEIVALAHVLGELRTSMAFEEGEFDSLTNGSPAAAALVADAALLAAHRTWLAVAVFALAAQAFAFVPDLDVARDAMGGDEPAVEVLEELGRWLSPMGAPSIAAPASFSAQVPVLGQALRAARLGADVARTSLRSVTNNPAYVAPLDGGEELVLHNGGYHDAAAGPAMDGMSLAWANLCSLADLQTTKLHSGELSGLPDMLAASGEDAWSTTAMLGFIPVGFGDRARAAAAPTVIPTSEGGGYGGQDDVSLATFLAYEKQEVAARQLECALAVLATTACQAFSCSDRAPSPALAPLAELVRSRVTFGDPARPRHRGAQMAAVADDFAQLVLRGRPPRSPAPVSVADAS